MEALRISDPRDPADADGSSPPTGILKALSEDSWGSIVQFLFTDDFFSCERLSRHARLILGRASGISRVYFQGTFEQHVSRRLHPYPSTSIVIDKATCMAEVCSYPFDVSCPGARELLSDILKLLRLSTPKGQQHHPVRHSLFSLLQGCTGMSSLDRPEESGANVLSKSFCLHFLNRTHSPLFANISQAQLGEHAQMNCGCSHHRPCYWSSRPSAVPNKTEFLSFSLAATVALVLGFSITPYQAFSHPDAPVYSPAEVLIQFLLPNDADATDGNARSSAGGAGGAGGAGSKKRGGFGSFPLAAADLYSPQVYYQSPPFAVQQTFSQQMFLLPRATLCLHGSVRIVMRGMVQRQTLGGIEHLEHATDYYTCLSHAGVYGLPLPVSVDVRLGPTATSSSVVLERLVGGESNNEREGEEEREGADGRGSAGGSAGRVQAALQSIVGTLFSNLGSSSAASDVNANIDFSLPEQHQLGREEAMELMPGAASFYRSFLEPSSRAR